MKKKKSTRPARTWRDYPDALHRRFTAQPNPESLHPDHDTVLAAVCGVAEARAIIASYAGLPVPIRIVAEVLQ